uniref:Estradiol 17-beta-dehydrogenase 12 n=1 Tax=Rhabditophanes sp. KR3021 TaxID=114890 RepID=A0AC35UFA1_9BILA
MAVCDWTLSVFGIIGLAVLGLWMLTVLFRILYPYVLTRAKKLNNLAGGDWAVVTGGTDGIGKAYAKELASQGFNILLISRSHDKLSDVEREIHDTIGNVATRTIAFDFTNANLEDYEDKIFPLLRNIEVGILVNNVGMATDYPDNHHLTYGGIKRIRDMNIINTMPASILSAEILEQMVPRNKGIIINIGSSAGSQKFYQWGVYSASKRYISHLSSIMAKEYSKFGVTIQCITPMIVTTRMSRVTQTSFFAPDPTTFVKSALKTVGHIRETTGYFTHQLQAEAINMMPSFLLDFIVSMENKAMKNRFLSSITTATSA